MTTAGFEYRKKKNETPFETFLRYTDEKEKSAIKLAAILQDVLQEDAHILDVGSGNGEYLELALRKVNVPNGVRLTSVEPSDDLVIQLEGRFKKRFSGTNLSVINSDLRSFDAKELFDVILMSHLFYHVPRSTWTEQLTKALSLLKPNGTLIIVLREKDDAYDFKMAFKPLLFDKSFKALTIDDVLAALPKDMGLENRKYTAESELKIPFEKDLEDTISIIEFYLNKEWAEMPEPIQHGALQLIKDKQGILKQRDCIATIKQL